MGSKTFHNRKRLTLTIVFSSCSKISFQWTKCIQIFSSRARGFQGILLTKFLVKMNESNLCAIWCKKLKKNAAQVRIGQIGNGKSCSRKQGHCNCRFPYSSMPMKLYQSIMVSQTLSVQNCGQFSKFSQPQVHMLHMLQSDCISRGTGLHILHSLQALCWPLSATLNSMPSDLSDQV